MLPQRDSKPFTNFATRLFCSFLCVWVCVCLHVSVSVCMCACICVHVRMCVCACIELSVSVLETISLTQFAASTCYSASDGQSHCPAIHVSTTYPKVLHTLHVHARRAVYWTSAKIYVRLDPCSGLPHLKVSVYGCPSQVCKRWGREVSEYSPFRLCWFSFFAVQFFFVSWLAHLIEEWEGKNTKILIPWLYFLLGAAWLLIVSHGFSTYNQFTHKKGTTVKPPSTHSQANAEEIRISDSYLPQILSSAFCAIHRFYCLVLWIIMNYCDSNYNIM